MKIVRFIALIALLASVSCAAQAQGKSAPKDAVLYFIWPQNGAIIKGGFWCRFGLRNMGVTHAGGVPPAPCGGYRQDRCAQGQFVRRLVWTTNADGP